MQENQDRMLAAKQTVDYANDLLNVLKFEPSTEEEENVINTQKTEIVKNLRDTGIWT